MPTATTRTQLPAMSDRKNRRTRRRPGARVRARVRVRVRRSSSPRCHRSAVPAPGRPLAVARHGPGALWTSSGGWRLHSGHVGHHAACGSAAGGVDGTVHRHRRRGGVAVDLQEVGHLERGACHGSHDDVDVHSSRSGAAGGSARRAPAPRSRPPPRGPGRRGVRRGGAAPPGTPRVGGVGAVVGRSPWRPSRRSAYGSGARTDSRPRRSRGSGRGARRDATVRRQAGPAGSIRSIRCRPPVGGGEPGGSAGEPTDPPVGCGQHQWSKGDGRTSSTSGPGWISMVAATACLPRPAPR